jgi:probable O-glycosylation ligase (exosortase A-associated)
MSFLRTQSSVPTRSHASRPTATAPRPSDGTEWLFALYVAVLAIEYGGLSGLIPILKVTRFSTLAAYALAFTLLLRRGPGPFKDSRQGRILVFLTIFGGASVLWAVVQSYVPSTLRYMFDYLLLFYMTACLVDRPSRVRGIAVIGTLIILVTVLRNLDGLLSASGVGRMVRFTAAYFMGDGNDMGWGLATLLAFPVFLVLGRNGVLLRLLGLGGTLATVIAIVLTQSRGASLALAAAFLYYAFVVSKRRILAIVMILAMGIAAWSLTSGDYRGRMESIAAYEEDSSAQARIRAWTAAIEMAIDYPLGVGIGSFSSAYGRYYRSDDLQGYGALRWISAHSVYFKMLGEQGFIGLFLLLVLLWTNLRDTHLLRLRLREASVEGPMPDQWPSALTIGLVGYSVGGMFLGGVTYPHLFLISGLIVACRRAVETSPMLEAQPALSETRTSVRMPKAVTASMANTGSGAAVVHEARSRRPLPRPIVRPRPRGAR